MAPTMPLQVTVIGGGMITHDQILPSLYHLQRLGRVGTIRVVGRRAAPLRELASAPGLKEAFPGQSFEPFPGPDDADIHPDLYERVVADMPPRNLVVVATPDPLHHAMTRHALEHDQHVLVVKPLVLRYREAAELERLALARGLFVGVEYHKRFDRRALEARKSYRAGRFGQFRLGEAKLIEPWYYRHSNFQNWFTRDVTDPFTYIGCHYTDLTCFITGLRPVEVSVQGVTGAFPNGNQAFMWSAARVTFDNGGILSVINGLGYPDAGAGSNDQGIRLFCESGDAGGLIDHNDQDRGVAHCYADGRSPHPFRYISPDYMRLVPWQGDGLAPVGYGYDSIEAHVAAAARVNDAPTLEARQATLSDIDARGLLATPANSWVNELVTEAGRLSILNAGARVAIRYDDEPRVEPINDALRPGSTLSTSSDGTDIPVCQ